MFHRYFAEARSILVMSDLSEFSSETETIHACALAIGEKGLLVLGASGAGKSRLINDILADQKRPRARMVADDRVVLSRRENQLIARPHPLIAGKIEIRGLGIRNTPYLEAVVLSAVIRLMTDMPVRMPEISDLKYSVFGIALPCINLPIQTFSSLQIRAILPHLG